MSGAAVWGEANVAEELKSLVAPIGKYQRYPKNPRKHTEKNLGLIQQSLLAHGQRKPIIVQASTGLIVAGNGTHEAAERLGWPEAAFSVQEMDDERAMAYLLADNKPSDVAEYDRKNTIAILEKMVEGPGLNSTLWTIDELEDEIAAEDAVPVADVAAFTGGYNETPESIAARQAEAVRTGGKRREIPLSFTVEDHARFIGWLKALQKKWGVSGTMATVYAAVKRQAEAEEGGVVPVTGEPLSENVRVAERRAALQEFRDAVLALGPDRQYTFTWIVAQLQAAMAAQDASQPVAGGSTAQVAAPEATIEQSPTASTEEPADEAPAGGYSDLPFDYADVADEADGKTFTEMGLFDGAVEG